MIPKAPENDVFYNAFSKTISEIARRLSRGDISEENWQLIGQYPSIMDDIIDKCHGSYKTGEYIKKFYDVNPHLKEDKELAAHFLFQVKEDQAISNILDMFEDKSYFFQDIERVANWLKQVPEFLYQEFFDGLRKNEHFFELMQDCDKIMLRDFELECPDKPERIKVWLDFFPLNYNYIPQKYKIDEDLLITTLTSEKCNDNLKLAIYKELSQEMKALQSVSIILVQAGHYSEVDNKNDPDIFKALCRHTLKRARKLSALRSTAELSLKPLENIMQHTNSKFFKNRQNIISLLETMAKCPITGDVNQNYQIWLPLLKEMKKNDPFIASVMEDKKSDGFPKWHMGLTMKEAKSWSNFHLNEYFEKQIPELSLQYQAYSSSEDLREILDNKDHVKTARVKI